MARPLAALAPLTPAPFSGDLAAARKALLDVARAMGEAAAEADFAREQQHHEARRDLHSLLKREAERAQLR